MLRLLRDEGPRPVQALAGRFDMRCPGLPEHLKALREAGLVSEQRSGRQRIHRLLAAPLAEVQDRLHPYERFWRGRMKDLGELLDRIPDGPTPIRPAPFTGRSHKGRNTRAAVCVSSWCTKDSIRTTRRG
ncbi:transcriptional regulator [Streptomyces sp. NTH33]|nr:transcriptional regulator [Streptomyces sp. NTH33]